MRRKFKLKNYIGKCCHVTKMHYADGYAWVTKEGYKFIYRGTHKNMHAIEYKDADNKTGVYFFPQESVQLQFWNEGKKPAINVIEFSKLEKKNAL